MSRDTWPGDVPPTVVCATLREVALSCHLCGTRQVWALPPEDVDAGVLPSLRCYACGRPGSLLMDLSRCLD